MKKLIGRVSGLLSGGLLACGLALFATNAHATTEINWCGSTMIGAGCNGDIFATTTQSIITWSNGGSFNYDANSGTDVNGEYFQDGSWTFGSGSFDTVSTAWNPIGSGFVTATVELSSATAQFNIITLSQLGTTWTFKIKFASGGIVGACLTPSMTVYIANDGTTSMPGVSTSAYNTTTGDFTIVSNSFTIPAITSGCGSSVPFASINSHFGLGSAGSYMDNFGTISPVMH